jgi:GrpB-like predicted nucleotidyltransferase (UPF0157 family)
VRKVEVVAYNPEWPTMFEKEAAILRGVLGKELVRIHHIGSTSVPGLSAKAIIDLLAEVRNIEKLDNLNEKMIASGYTPKGEYGIPGRRYFFRGSEEKHSYHLHAFQEGNPEIERHLLFRDFLRSHLQEASEYAYLKELLALKFPSDIEAYMQGKDALIKEIDRKARTWASGNRP